MLEYASKQNEIKMLLIPHRGVSPDMLGDALARLRTPVDGGAWARSQHHAGNLARLPHEADQEPGERVGHISLVDGRSKEQEATLVNEWVNARIYGRSAERAAALTAYVDRYNYRRPHGSLSHQPPALRLNNLPGNYT